VSKSAGRFRGCRRAASSAGEADAILDRDESAPDDDPAAAPERPAVVEDAQLVLVGEEQVELEARVAKEPGKADEPVEDVLDAPAPRRASGRERFALAADPDDRAQERDGCNETHAMVPGEPFQLTAKRGEAARLDLDQQLAADEVDNETVDELLDAIAGAAVPVLELSVQRTLVSVPIAASPRTAQSSTTEGMGALLRCDRIAFTACDQPERPRHIRVGNTDSAAQPDRLLCTGTELYRVCPLICPATLDAASLELHGICRAKIADRKVSPHDGGMTALASGSGSSPVPSVSALIVTTTSRPSARRLPSPHQPTVNNVTGNYI
jgi:hypothetical protein